jgi:hypothetical protein
MDNIFQQDPTSPNFITIQLGRSLDASNQFPGTFTFGEVLDGMQDVMNQPKLPLIISPNSVNQEWLTHLDGIAVNGQSVQLPQTTVQTNPDPSRLITLFDTGFTFPQFPT